MLVSTNWIRDFVDIPYLKGNEIAKKITLSTAEVESFISINDHLKLIYIVQITSIRKHENADSLNLVSFKDGKGEIREVVCGAPNVREGLKVPYASLGTVLPNGMIIKGKKIRGYQSEGMLCSSAELGLGDGDASGLLELPEDAPLGLDLLSFYQFKEDIVLDIDNKSLTHRPDLWGHYGFAREFSAIWKTKLLCLYDEQWIAALERNFTSDVSPITPIVEKESACLSYWALSIEGVRVESSPLWMQDRLKACGMRPINSIVDISNYVMLELGVPNHIFDLDKISGDTLKIALLEQETEFTTLDGERRKLQQIDTVISDKKVPLVIAGIMGGKDSEVTDNTHRILIEVANWKASSIRCTSQRLGLRTESSQRYEKSIDGNLCYQTLLRILELVLQFNPHAKVLGKPQYDGIDLSQTPVLEIETSVSKINERLGKRVEREIIFEILKSLDFILKEEGEKLFVGVPSFRGHRDIECEADIIEEVGRMIGYDNIEPLSPLMPIITNRLSPVKTLHRKVQDYLILKGRCLEVMTSPMVGETLLQKCHWPELNEQLQLINPVSSEASRMRPSLIPSALEVVRLNQKNYSSFSFFELGRSYWPAKDFSQERSQLIIAFFDRRENHFQQAINEAENLLRFLHLPAQVGRWPVKTNDLIPEKWNGFHPHEYQDIRIVGKNSGVIFSVHSLILRKFKIKGLLSLVVIDFTDIEDKMWNQKIHYQPLSKYPSSTFDCTVVASLKTPIGDILHSLDKRKVRYLQQFKVVNVFFSQDREKYVTLRATFSDTNKTLSSEEVKASELTVVEGLERSGFPLKP